MLLSTLKSYLEAMGGTLKLVVDFPGSSLVLSQLGEACLRGSLAPARRGETADAGLELEPDSPTLHVARSRWRGEALHGLPAIKLLAELGQVSLRAPEDKPASQQHLHVHGFVDRPREETQAEWVARRQREMAERLAKQPGPSAPPGLNLVDTD
jgi:hypothetical protein